MSTGKPPHGEPLRASEVSDIPIVSPVRKPSAPTPEIRARLVELATARPARSVSDGDWIPLRDALLYQLDLIDERRERRMMIERLHKGRLGVVRSLGQKSKR